MRREWKCVLQLAPTLPVLMLLLRAEQSESKSQTCHGNYERQLRPSFWTAVWMIVAENKSEPNIRNTQYADEEDYKRIGFYIA